MRDDPVQYWQDLTDNYRRMSDGELLQLAQKPEDLTDVARQVLRDEIGKRNLDKLPSSRSSQDALTGAQPKYEGGPAEPPFDAYQGASELEEAPGAEAETSPEYTWKTLLCDCESNAQAAQLGEALRRAGIDAWVKDVPRSSTDAQAPQVYVAADQLEQAQVVAAQPIPQDIVDEWNTELPEFEIPSCPRCGSGDEVVLASADPANTWLCESCGAEWTEPGHTPGEEPKDF